jgi:hypothetical protein
MRCVLCFELYCVLFIRAFVSCLCTIPMCAIRVRVIIVRVLVFT